jgi:hypothetical protein
LLQAEPVHPHFDLKADQAEDNMAYFQSLERCQPATDTIVDALDRVGSFGKVA